MWSIRTALLPLRTKTPSYFTTYKLPIIIRGTRRLSNMPHTVPKLKDPSLLKTNVAYVNGRWVSAKSGVTYDVKGLQFLSNYAHIV